MGLKHWIALGAGATLMLAGPVKAQDAVQDAAQPEEAETSVFFDYEGFMATLDVTEEERADINRTALEATAFNSTLEPKRGHVDIPRAGAHLDLGEDFYFVSGGDARRIITAWGNPPNTSTLGLIFPVGQDYMVNDYAVEISFVPSGYVSDADAATIDYDELMREMQAGVRADNAERTRQRLVTYDLLGWAEPPRYDAQTHVMHWAQRLQFHDGLGSETLNYNVRYLGRRGVLEFNYIAEIDALETIKATIPDISAMAAFDAGNTYDDFDPATDETAAYGLAGLVAGGAAVAAKKTGLLAVLILFLKKGWVLILAGGAFLLRLLRGASKRHEPDVT